MNFHTHIEERQRKQDQDIIDLIYEHDGYCLEALLGILSQVETVLDIGGHIGSFGLKVLSYWPTARLVAYEPNPSLANLYRDNLSTNNLSGTVIVEAVDADSNKTSLTEDELSTGGGILVCEGESVPGHEITVYDVKVTSFGEALAANNLETVDLLKLDCEGSEVGILRTMSADTAAKIKWIVGEYHMDGGFAAFKKLLLDRFPDFGIIVLGTPGPFIGEFMAGPKNLI